MSKVVVPYPVRRAFADRFKTAYEEWVISKATERKPHTQSDFAKEVCANFTSRTNKPAKIDKNNISKYLRAEAIPTKYFDDIIAVLGVDESYFAGNSSAQPHESNRIEIHVYFHKEAKA